MGGASRGDASIQAFFSPTPSSSPIKSTSPAIPSSDSAIGDGFTAEEVQEALKPKPAEPWHPSTEYAELEIRDLEPGPKAVTFMGRIANIFDVANTPKTPRSAKGCVKLCVKDDKGAITVLQQPQVTSLYVPNLMTVAGPTLVCKALAKRTTRFAGIGLDYSQFVPTDSTF